jgi:hypothetical protein
MSMTEPATDPLSDSFAGWTIAEAIERTTGPDDLCASAEDGERGSSRQSTAFWQRLSSGELVATGRFDAPTAQAILIDPKEFSALGGSGSPSTNLVRVSGAEVQVFDVRVFPVLRAPDAPNYLNGLSLSEAFRRYVINDPEVVALAKRLLKTDARHSTVFLEGQAPGYFVDFHWPLESTASAVAYRFVDSPVVFMDDPIPTPSASIAAVSEALADRMAGLRGLLASGRIVAVGAFAQTGIEVPIGRFQWRRSGMSIDVSNGDLCEGHDYRAVAKWTGLGLCLPETRLPANQPQAVITAKVVEPPRKAKMQIVTKEKCRLDCIAWLEHMMSDPEVIPRSRDDLWTEAQSKWPNKLSQRDFLKARDAAIASKEAWNWKAPGRRPKSPHS